MSRIGKNPVELPAKVKAEVNDNQVKVEGPKGKLEKSFDRAVSIQLEDGKLVVEPANSSRHSRAMWGTARSLIEGMVTGVQEPYKKDLEINGVGFRANLQGQVLNLALGFSHPVNITVPAGINVDVDKSGTKLSVTGCDKQAVGQLAADIKSWYPVEPYKGKGVRIVGQFVRRKEGKKAG
jgi:large subunit ribosomal protein L6